MCLAQAKWCPQLLSYPAIPTLSCFKLSNWSAIGVLTRESLFEVFKKTLKILQNRDGEKKRGRDGEKEL